MKRNIYNMPQQMLLDYGLDPLDIILLDWLVQFVTSGNMRATKLDDKVYYWVHYKYVIQELPILGIKSTRQLRRRMIRLDKSGVLSMKHLENNRPYFCFTDKWNYLVSSTSGVDIHVPPEGTSMSMQRGHPCPVSNYDSTIKDNTIKIQRGEALKDTWNKMALTNGLPTVKDLSAQRLATLKKLPAAFWHDYPQALAKVEKSDFLLGKTSRDGWVIKFDWFIKGDNWLKVLEGQYDGKKATPSLGAAAKKL